MYQCLQKQTFGDSSHYRLVSIRLEDAEAIRQWRNAQMDVLRQKKHISQAEQKDYFDKSIYPSFVEQHPTQVIFSYFFHQELIGYGGLTHLDWEAGRAEVSFLVDPIRAQNSTVYAKDFKHFLSLLEEIAFGHLHLHRLFTETFAFRQEHMAILEKAGFKREGILREHVYHNGAWIDSWMHGRLIQETSYAR